MFSPRKDSRRFLDIKKSVKPKKLLETKKAPKKGVNQKMIDNMQDFFEKSLSRIMKTTPRHANPDKNVGMLFFNAINSIRADSKNKPALGNFLNSKNSSELNRYQPKKTNFRVGMELELILIC